MSVTELAMCYGCLVREDEGEELEADEEWSDMVGICDFCGAKM